eukprot:4558017-Amphidinium_carterae.1
MWRSSKPFCSWVVMGELLHALWEKFKHLRRDMHAMRMATVLTCLFPVSPVRTECCCGQLALQFGAPSQHPPHC